MAKVLYIAAFLALGLLVGKLDSMITKAKEPIWVRFSFLVLSLFVILTMAYLTYPSFVSNKTKVNDTETYEVNAVPETLTIGEGEDAVKLTIDYNLYRDLIEDELRTVKDDIITYNLFIQYCKDKVEYTEEEFEEFMKTKFNEYYGKTDNIEETAKQSGLDYEFLKLLYREQFVRELYTTQLMAGLEVTEDEIVDEYNKSPLSYNYVDLVFIQCESADILNNTVEVVKESGLDKLDYLQGVEVIKDGTVNLVSNELSVVLDNESMIGEVQSYSNEETGEYYIVILQKINDTVEDCHDVVKTQVLVNKAEEIINAEVLEYYQTVAVE